MDEWGKEDVVSRKQEDVMDSSCWIRYHISDVHVPTGYEVQSSRMGHGGMANGPWINNTLCRDLGGVSEKSMLY